MHICIAASLFSWLVASMPYLVVQTIRASQHNKVPDIQTLLRSMEILLLLSDTFCIIVSNKININAVMATKKGACENKCHCYF